MAWKHSGRFSLVSAGSALPAKRLKNAERIRAILSNANDQLKNGRRYEDAPCLLTVFHDGLDVPDNAIIMSALYGNLKFAFAKVRPNEGELVFDKDGGWTPEKNRTTSADLYIRNGGEPPIVHNYWAQRPFPTGLFGCREVSLQPNGTFQEIDFANHMVQRSILRRIARIPVKLIGFLRQLLDG